MDCGAASASAKRSNDRQQPHLTATRAIPAADAEH